MTAPEPTDIRPQHRSRILKYAASIVPVTDRGDPQAVIAAAVPLLAWAQQAASHADLSSRMDALSHQYVNGRPGAGDPGAFVSGARDYYEFITGGAPVAPDADLAGFDWADDPVTAARKREIAAKLALAGDQISSGLAVDGGQKP